MAFSPAESRIFAAEMQHWGEKAAARNNAGRPIL
jgi:hypothetical protein